MARKSKLSDSQWTDIKRRHLVGGESVNSLAKEYGVGEKTIRDYLKKPSKTLGYGNSGNESPNEVTNSPESNPEPRGEHIKKTAVALIKAAKDAGLAQDDQGIALELATAMTIRSQLYEVAGNHLAVALRTSRVAKANADRLVDENGAVDVEILKQLSVMAEVGNRFSFIGMETSKADKAAQEQTEGKRVIVHNSPARLGNG